MPEGWVEEPEDDPQDEIKDDGDINSDDEPEE
jgi:hypothetical protein